jgi:hypothetical protein
MYGNMRIRLQDRKVEKYEQNKAAVNTGKNMVKTCCGK